MSKHLSEDEFAKCLADQFASAELQHVAECAECAAELERFGKTVSLFRNAMRDRIAAQVALKPPQAIPPFPVRTAGARVRTWHWAWVTAAVLVFAIVPLLTPKPEPPQITETAPPPMSPDALMNAVNLHLSRTVPAPMERMILVIPNDDSTNPSGGVQ